ncbi:hypothetical protein HDU96_002841 [Phlyctochytrium bullatum]|nr:hypothetical protein HDU96_002841 [Phlyctochytrium bullatum]
MTPRSRSLDDTPMSPSPSSTTGPLKLRVGCVPEHFSCPLYMAAADGLFKSRGIDVEIVNCPQGTGQMIRMLKSGELDIAAALTEGLIAPLATHLRRLRRPPPPSTTSSSDATPTPEDPGYRLIGTYTSRPLTWSIAVRPHSLLAHRSTGSLALLASTTGPLGHLSRPSSRSDLTASPTTSETSTTSADDANALALDALRNTRLGISRFGSGSHIIPFVVAWQRGWGTATTPFTFVELKDIKGLCEGVESGTVDAFLWERFTTKPYYDAGRLHHYANVTPPWPGFLFAARTGSLSDPVHAAAVRQFLAGVTESARRFAGAMAENPVGAVREMRARFGMLSPAVMEEDMVRWTGTVGYPLEVGEVSEGVVRECCEVLEMAGVVERGLEGSMEGVEGMVGMGVCKLVA